jgi:hypothetical protein
MEFWFRISLSALGAISTTLLFGFGRSLYCKVPLVASRRFFVCSYDVLTFR